MDHTRIKIKRSNDTEADIISDLPRDVIHEIWERLPLRDAARMCILSHKWQDIWTSTPHLTFDVHFCTSVLKEEVHEALKFCSVVSKILFQHEGPIHKFSLFVPSLNACPDVDQWISHLSRNGLRDFSLWNAYIAPLKLSSRLFSCGELEKLKLHFCIFRFPLNFEGFPKLTSLELDRVVLRYKTFKDLIGSCPVLQKLVLTNFTGLEQMNIVIDIPKLRYLTIDWVFGSLDVKFCESLVSASFGIQKLVSVHKGFLGDLAKVLANSSKLERLCFRCHFCRVLINAGSIRNTFEKLKNLELLSLHLDYLDDLSSVISCIQSFSNIETLKITVISSTNLAGRLVDSNSDFTLHHLRCAKIGILSAFTTELKLIEFLLACSPVLERLSVHTPLLKRTSRSRMLMQLNRFRRASRMVEVICPENTLPKRSVHVATSPSTSDSSSDSA
ncbi:F-box/FBD/LRR-repeat protein At1g13570-like [Chenopodium quinoa]|uniref:F-box domain-containing protein n=1 Tax=Chenopodium quinoa TaxID=63459 RepID=A0A803L7F7_CHEQI|nr:F-box/FBD/LRR-repeat protein At1g13570-like [Chenopodium quinoa]